ncbi:MAG TPA: hypothetical protein VEK38_00150 [Candidatus Bathyarchaeia archaeon]|nr:hypothetical protein [Candidatus Bathyarchaeia archaeon]
MQKNYFFLVLVCTIFLGYINAAETNNKLTGKRKRTSETEKPTSKRKKNFNPKKQIAVDFLSQKVSCLEQENSTLQEAKENLQDEIKKLKLELQKKSILAEQHNRVHTDLLNTHKKYIQELNAIKLEKQRFASAEQQSNIAFISVMQKNSEQLQENIRLTNDYNLLVNAYNDAMKRTNDAICAIQHITKTIYNEKTTLDSIRTKLESFKNIYSHDLFSSPTISNSEKTANTSSNKTQKIIEFIPYQIPDSTKIKNPTSKKNSPDPHATAIIIPED